MLQTVSRLLPALGTEDWLNSTALPDTHPIFHAHHLVEDTLPAVKRDSAVLGTVV